MADEGVPVVVRADAPAWTGAAACWAGRAGDLVEMELGCPGVVVASEEGKHKREINIIVKSDITAQNSRGQFDMMYSDVYILCTNQYSEP